MLDRELQARFLRRLAEDYPKGTAAHVFVEWGAERPVEANLMYLQEHDLVRTDMRTMANGEMALSQAKVTAKGLDFLADDGGLSAILGVVTIKLHYDTIRQLLLAKVDASDAPADAKERLKDAIRGLPAEGLRHVTMELLRGGLDRIPDAVPYLMRLLQGGG